MIIKLQTKSDANSPLIVALFEGEAPESSLLGKNTLDLVAALTKSKVFSGKKDQILNSVFDTKTKPRVILLYGLGKEADWNEKEARNFGAKIIRAAKGVKEKTVDLRIPSLAQDDLQAFAEGILLGDYNPAIYKTGEEQKKREKEALQTISLLAKDWDHHQRERISRAQALAETINDTRDLVNCGPNHLSISAFVDEIRGAAKEHSITITDLDKKKLEKLGMGGLLAVNRGSEESAHMVILEHKGAKEEPLVICGKGIVFDTGGISLKPSNSMQDMQLDMAGAAVVLGVFKLLKKLDIKRHVIGIMPITDNAVGPHSYRPSDIISTYSGKTVEIANTDAEGRMILCDALSYAVDKYKPKYLIDLATLTGACMVALGYRTAGLFGTDQGLIEKIKTAAQRTDEAVCHLPITEADEKSIKGKLADLTNLADVPYGGACRAAAFLKQFVGETKWAHLDIAGTAFTKEPKDYEVNMATGYGIRLLVDFLENL
ncbi:MAG: leucyl aminopeptidase [bacterium]|nr:leucyl aminopeptidase [bacterium]